VSLSVVVYSLVDPVGFYHVFPLPLQRLLNSLVVLFSTSGTLVLALIMNSILVQTDASEKLSKKILYNLFAGFIVSLLLGQVASGIYWLVTGVNYGRRGLWFGIQFFALLYFFWQRRQIHAIQKQATSHLVSKNRNDRNERVSILLYYCSFWMLFTTFLFVLIILNFDFLEAGFLINLFLALAFGSIGVLQTTAVINVHNFNRRKEREFWQKVFPCCFRKQTRVMIQLGEASESDSNSGAAVRLQSEQDC